MSEQQPTGPESQGEGLTGDEPEGMFERAEQLSGEGEQTERERARGDDDEVDADLRSTG